MPVDKVVLRVFQRFPFTETRSMVFSRTQTQRQSLTSTISSRNYGSKSRQFFQVLQA